jgi:hypothetical protein
LRLKEESRISYSFDNFMEEESIVKLDFFVSNIKKHVCGVLDFLFWKI